jgi:hypothetical protein
MSQIETSGYKGAALEALKNCGCDVGDILKITSE